jgi:hypothetical protein
MLPVSNRAWTVSCLLLLLAALGVALAVAWSQRAPDLPPRAPEPAAQSPGSDPAPLLLGTRPASGAVPRVEEDVPPPPLDAPKIQHRFVVRGVVRDAAMGYALPEVRVLGCIGCDGRDLRTVPDAVASVSDGDGRYELAFLIDRLPCRLAFTALHPGHRTPHAALARDGEVEIPRTTLEVAAAGEETLDFALWPGTHVAGIVVDENGARLGGVSVVATLRAPKYTTYVEWLETDATGTFSIHDLTLPEGEEEAGAKGTLAFTHPAHVSANVDDVFAIDPTTRRTLRIVMPHGLTLAGTLEKSDGTPAADVLVEALRADPKDNLRGAYTDARGSFAVEGLAPGRVTLRALSAADLSSVAREITLLRSEEGIRLRLAPLAFARSAPRERALGLEFVVVPEAEREALGIYKDYALLITDVTNEALPAFLEHARVGDCLWRVGERAVRSARDVSAGIVEQVDRFDEWRRKGGRPLEPTCPVRFVIGIRRPGFAGTNTQQMTLPRGQVEEFRRWLAEHPEPK